MTEGETQRTFTSILYPQTLASPLVFTATIDNWDYTNGVQIKPELNAGNSYTYTITVKKTGLGNQHLHNTGLDERWGT